MKDLKFKIISSYIFKRNKGALLILSFSLAITFIISSSLLNLQENTRNKLISLVSFDYKIQSNEGINQDIIDKYDNIYAYSSFDAILRANGSSNIIKVRFLDFDDYKDSRFLKNLVIVGEEGVNISLPLASKLRLKRGDSFQLLNFENKKLQTKTYKITGLFASEYSLFDYSYILIDKDREDLKDVKYGIYSNENLKNLSSSYDEYGILLGALDFEKLIMSFFLYSMLLIILLFIYQNLKRFLNIRAKSFSFIFLSGVQSTWLYKLFVYYALIFSILATIFSNIIAYLLLIILEKIPIFRVLKVGLLIENQIKYSIFLFIIMLLLSLISAKSYHRKKMVEVLNGKNYNL